MADKQCANKGLADSSEAAHQFTRFGLAADRNDLSQRTGHRVKELGSTIVHSVCRDLSYLVVADFKAAVTESLKSFFCAAPLPEQIRNRVAYRIN